MSRSANTFGRILARPAGYDFTGYRLIPGVLHAYKASPADLARYVRPGHRDRHGHHDHDNHDHPHERGDD